MEGALTHAQELSDGRRFAFGQNWERFLKVLNQERIEIAESSLRDMLAVNSLNGMSFLDAGCGSGLFSLAAKRLGARVHSFDYDPQSVECARELKSRYYPGDATWTIEEASVLDGEYLKGLGKFDIVYSWGVLHHTGNMLQALSNVAELVRDGGKLFIAIYNEMETGPKRRWIWIKRQYCSLPAALRLPFASSVIFLRELYPITVHTIKGKIGKYIACRRNYDKTSLRGMSWWHDQIDWIGGFPYESAKPEHIFLFCKKRGFRLEQLTTSGGGLGCNQFVFSKCSETSA